jgi:hypothetical protein
LQLALQSITLLQQGRYKVERSAGASLRPLFPASSRRFIDGPVPGGKLQFTTHETELIEVHVGIWSTQVTATAVYRP